MAAPSVADGVHNNAETAGRVLYEVIAERQASLRALVQESVDHPLSTNAVVEFVEKPLDR